MARSQLNLVISSLFISSGRTIRAATASIRNDRPIRLVSPKQFRLQFGPDNGRLLIVEARENSICPPDTLPLQHHPDSRFRHVQNLANGDAKSNARSDRRGLRRGASWGCGRFPVHAKLWRIISAFAQSEPDSCASRSARRIRLHTQFRFISPKACDSYRSGAHAEKL